MSSQAIKDIARQAIHFLRGGKIVWCGACHFARLKIKHKQQIDQAPLASVWQCSLNKRPESLG